ncbi:MULTISPECIES: TolC family protein [Sphingobacterium]|uniref:TolC family protein n=1 Tax=Sphingobacterium TaxID=28453 RepID=UPI00257DE158|nr:MULTISPECIES: TolC family protein [Sphingobacterium]
MKKIILMLLFLITVGSLSFGQSVTLPAEGLDYTKLLLPSLEELFENAKKSPSVEMFESKMMEQDNQLKTEKRSWLKYFKVGGSWQYGNIGVNSMFTDQNTPLFYQYSGATQNARFVSGTVSVPFDDLFDRSNRVKRQKMQRRSTELEMEKWFDEQKLRIIDSYVKLTSAMSVLKKIAENLTLTQAQVKSLEADFANGNAEIAALTVAKKMEVDAYETFKITEGTITAELLHLEILSRTKIISK